MSSTTEGETGQSGDGRHQASLALTLNLHTQQNGPLLTSTFQAVARPSGSTTPS
jgi:hypothetical protein